MDKDRKTAKLGVIWMPYYSDWVDTEAHVPRGIKTKNSLRFCKEFFCCKVMSRITYYFSIRYVLPFLIFFICALKLGIKSAIVSILLSFTFNTISEILYFEIFCW